MRSHPGGRHGGCSEQASTLARNLHANFMSWKAEDVREERALRTPLGAVALCQAANGSVGDEYRRLQRGAGTSRSWACSGQCTREAGRGGHVPNMPGGAVSRGQAGSKLDSWAQATAALHTPDARRVGSGAVKAVLPRSARPSQHLGGVAASGSGKSGRAGLVGLASTWWEGPATPHAKEMVACRLHLLAHQACAPRF